MSRHKKKRTAKKVRRSMRADQRNIYIKVIGGLETTDKSYDEMVYQGLLDPCARRFIEDIKLYDEFLECIGGSSVVGHGIEMIDVYKDGIGRIHFTLRVPVFGNRSGFEEKKKALKTAWSVIFSVYDAFFLSVMEHTDYDLHWELEHPIGPVNDWEYDVFYMMGAA